MVHYCHNIFSVELGILKVWMGRPTTTTDNGQVHTNAVRLECDDDDEKVMIVSSPKCNNPPDYNVLSTSERPPFVATPSTIIPIQPTLKECRITVPNTDTRVVDDATVESLNNNKESPMEYENGNQHLNDYMLDETIDYIPTHDNMNDANVIVPYHINRVGDILPPTSPLAANIGPTVIDGVLQQSRLTNEPSLSMGNETGNAETVKSGDQQSASIMKDEGNVMRGDEEQKQKNNRRVRGRKNNVVVKTYNLKKRQQPSSQRAK